MADSTDQKDQKDQQTDAPNDDKETGFWTKLQEVVRGEVKAEFEDRVKNSKPVGTSRTGRKTIPDFLADIMWPGEKS